MKLSKMAWRNLWRNRRRTLVTVSAMTLALGVMICYSGIVAGYLAAMERNILDRELGEIQVFAQGYRDNASLYTRINDAEALLAELDKAKLPASARLLASGLAAAGDSSAGVTFRGVDVERDARISQVQAHVAQGKWLDPSQPRGVVIGRKLARILNVKPGAELVALTQGADGSMANELYRVRGVLKGISDVVDRSGIYITSQAFRELLVFPEGAHQIIVRRPADMTLEAAAATVSSLTSDSHDVKTWRQLIPTLATMLDSARGVQYVMFLIVFIAIGIVILNAMLMAVFERIREFGVLKALGMGPGKVLRLILLESLMQTGLAILVGGSISVPGLFYLSRVGIDLGAFGGASIVGIAVDTVMRAEVSAQTFTGPIFTMLFVVLMAVLYPAIKAALIRPVTAMQYR
jgi:ABC-type lipoprotein release transport system permease subunit